MFNGALPPFGIDTLHLVLVLVRAVWLAGLLSAAGALTFVALEGDAAMRIRLPLQRLTLASLAVAGVGWVGWVAVQTAVMGSAAGIAAMLAALPVVLGQTAFGHIAVAQLALLTLTAAVLPLAGRAWGRWVAALLAMAAVALAVGHLHAWAMTEGLAPLTVAALAHVLGVAAWLGGLLPLRLLIGSVSPAHAAAAARRFSNRAGIFVALLVAGALVQGWELLGGLPGILGTAYGWVAILKAVLLVVLLVFAALNRARLTPALARPDPAPARTALLRNIAIETWLGLAAVTAASLLGSLQPGMHAQPVWPFTFQISMAPLRDDAGLLRSVIFGGLALVAAVAVAVGLLIGLRGRWRWLALALPVVVAVIMAPRLAPLFVPAVPTSFATSPTGFAATAIVDGAGLYAQHCASCHGADGRGDGPESRALPVPPGDLTAAYLWEHPDGELFWWLSHGIEAPFGGPAMPGFAATLDDDARWHLIDYLRAHNAGAARTAADAGERPDRAPDFAADCDDGRSVGLPDLRGRLVRVVFQGDGAAPSRVVEPPGVGVSIVLVARDDTPAPAGVCVVSDPAVREAYAIATGLAPAALDGSEVLIDQNGWLRDVVPAHIDSAELANTLRRIAASPLAAGAVPEHMHHHG